jgi:hypothetical protein
MALVYADRVKETSTTTGTGTYNLAGAVTGFQGFVAGIATGNTCYYTATDGTDWEVGIGTVTDATPDTLARTTILQSSNSDNAVNWGAGTRTLFVTQPADRAGPFLITSGSFTAVTNLDITGLGGFRYLKFVIKGSRPATDAVAARVHFSSDNGSTFTAANVVTNVVILTGTTVSGLSVAAADYYALNGDDTTTAGSVGNAAGEGIWGTLEIEGFNQAAQKPMKSAININDVTTVRYLYLGHGFDDTTTALNAIRFNYDAGDIAAVGTYEVWGIRG